MGPEPTPQPESPCATKIVRAANKGPMEQINIFLKKGTEALIYESGAQLLLKTIGHLPKTSLDTSISQVFATIFVSEPPT